jgi:hypothetical protein
MKELHIKTPRIDLFDLPTMHGMQQDHIFHLQLYHLVER